MLDDIDYERKVDELIRNANRGQKNQQATATSCNNNYMSSCSTNISNNMLLMSREECMLIEHAFNLIKYTNVNELFRKFKTIFNCFLNKLELLQKSLTSNAGGKKNKHVASKF